MSRRTYLWIIPLSVIALVPSTAKPDDALIAKASNLSAALPPAEWARVEGAVDRGLAWLASQQEQDGRFPGEDSAQPATTAFAVMAFLSRGHLIGLGTPDEVTRQFGKATIEDVFIALQQRDEGIAA